MQDGKMELCKLEYETCSSGGPCGACSTTPSHSAAGCQSSPSLLSSPLHTPSNVALPDGDAKSPFPVNKKIKTLPMPFKHVYFSPSDRPFSVVRVDVKLLDYYEARSATMIRNEKPLYNHEDGTPVYAFWGTKAVLLSLLQSLTTATMTIVDGVSVKEMLTVFEYEMVSVGTNRLATIGATRGLLPDGEKVVDALERICSSVACAIRQWPGLAYSLESSLLNVANETAVSASPTRAWISFPPPLPPSVLAPSVEELDGLDFVYELARRQACHDTKFLLFSVVAIARIFVKMTNNASKTLWTMAVFERLEQCVDHDPAGYFISALYHYGSAVDNALSIMNEELKVVATLANSWFRCIARAGPKSDTVEFEESVVFCRSVVQLVLDVTRGMPNLHKIFGTQTLDAHGNGPERSALATALKKYGIKIVRWSNCQTTAQALTFPPFLSRPVGVAAAATPCVLLDFCTAVNW